MSNQPDPNAIIVDSKTFDYAIVHDADGNVVHNSFQQDDPVIRRKWSDGTYDAISSKDGRMLLPRFNPYDEKWKHRCVHCGKDPFNE